MCRLNQLRIGESGIIEGIEDDLEIKKRLLDMGFHKGNLIECMMRGSFRGPIAYKIQNTVIALRESDAKKIHVGVEA